MLRRVLPLISLLKLRIVALLLFVSLGAAILAGDGDWQMMPLALLLLTGTLSAGGAGALNQYLERDLDGMMERTRRRPLVSGRIGKPVIALVLGVSLVGVSFLIALPVKLWQAVFLLTGALIYVVLYTLWLKRRSPWNIVVGGAAGSCAVLAGWASVGDWLAPQPLLIALLLFFWTPPHFWSLSILRIDEYRQANIPMLPVVAGEASAARWSLIHAVLVVSTSLILPFTGQFGLPYWAASSLGGSLFIATSLSLALRPDKTMAKLNFRVSIFYLTAVFAGMILDALI